MNVTYNPNSTEYSFKNFWDQTRIQKIEDALKNINADNFIHYDWKVSIPKKSILSWFSRPQPTTIKLIANTNLKMTLEDYLKDFHQNKRNDYDELLYIMSQLWYAVYALHNIQTTKDIKMYSFHPRNILLTKDKRGRYNAQIMHYIPSLFFDKNDDDNNIYIHPQQLSNLLKGNDEYVEDSELYSFAVLVCKVYTNFLPYEESNIINDGNNNVSMPKLKIQTFPNRVAEEFVKGVLKGDLSFERCINSGFIQLAKQSASSKQCNIKDFKIEKFISRGAFGMVYTATQKILDNKTRKVAIKFIDLTNKTSEYDKVRVENEVDLMKLCSSERFVNVYNLFYTNGTIGYDLDPNSEYAAIVMEYCRYGTLEDFWIKNFNQTLMPIDFMESLTSQLLKGLWYLHGMRGIAHRDIKPKNVFIQRDSNDPSKYLFKISDFGAAKLLSSNKNLLVTTIGTSEYAAPEIQQNPNRESEWIGYTYKIDLWSLGVMLYYLRTHIFPISNHNIKNSLHKKFAVNPVFHDMQWKGAEDMEHFVSRLIVVDDDDRIGWPEIYRTPYLRKLMNVVDNTKFNFSNLVNVSYKMRKDKSDFDK